MAVVLLLAMAGIVGAPTKVEALSDGSISGTVTGAQGEPLQGVFVGVFDELDVSVGQAPTDASGHFSISQLPTNQLLRLSVVPDFFSPYQTKSITGVVLGPAESRVIDVQFSLGSSVTGHVTTVDGAPVTGRISLYEINTGAQNGAGVFGGNFAVPNITPGTWVAYAASGQVSGDPYAPEYFGGGYTLADATPIVIADGAQVTGIDITLDLGATITGQVLDDQGRPAPNANVDIPVFNGPPGSFAYQRFSTMSADSRYTLVGLPPGAFSLVATSDPVTGLGRASIPVTVAPGDALTGVDISMRRGVFGVVQVMDTNGSIPPGPSNAFPVVCDAAVVVSDPFAFCGQFLLEYAVPNPIGSGWIVGPLAPGDYTAQSFTGNSFGSSTALHASAGGGFSCTLPLPGSGVAECVDAPAPATGSVDGRVVGVDGIGVPGVEVHAWVGGTRPSTLPTRTFTDANGEYTLSDVFVGDVQIEFIAPPTRLDLRSSWWAASGSASTQATAGTLTVAQGAALTGIDGVLPSVAHGTITLTRNGVPITAGFGFTAAFCAAPSVFLVAGFRCSDGQQAITVGNNAAPLPPSQIPPGTYNAQAFEFSVFGPTVGAPTRVVLAGGDEFDCTLPVEATAIASCTVNGAALDSTPPIIEGQLTPALPDGDNGWWRSDVSAHWTVSEPESAASVVTVGCQDRLFASDTTGDQSTCSATSDGGPSAPQQLFVKRDATAPGLLWINGYADGQVFAVGQVPSEPWCSPIDTTSGPNGCVVTGWSDQPGTHTLTATARDMAGNATTETRTYTVNTPYTLKGFYAPVRMGSVNRVSVGSEVELRFEVFDGATEVRDPAVVRSFSATPVSCSTGVASGPSTDVLGGRALRYDARKGVFSAEWKVPKRTRGCIDITVTVDGTSLTAHFRVR